MSAKRPQALVAACERFAIGGEEFGVGKEAADHGDDALVEDEDCAESLGEVLLRGGASDGLLEGLKGEEHLREALL